MFGIEIEHYPQVDRLRRLLEVDGSMNEELMKETHRIIQSSSNSREAKIIADAVFCAAKYRDNKDAQTLLEESLQVFLDSAGKDREDLGLYFWTDSFSRIVDMLWQFRMDAWIKKFYGVAFGPTIIYLKTREDGISNLILVDAFIKHATWEEDPAGFHLTPDKFRWDWLDLKKDGPTISRVMAGRFTSKAKFLEWRLSWPWEYYLDSIDEVEGYMLSVEKLKEDIEYIRNHDPSLACPDILSLLSLQLIDFQKELSRWQTEKNSNNVGNLAFVSMARRGIAMTEREIEKLGTK